MSGALANGLSRQSGMAVGASSRNTVVIKRHHRPEGGTGMTAFAWQVGR